ncbi:hypothetical protein FIBSPDRAFT_847521 [Athelia psychrophila]|uniref:Uncharacterized protein n=1 Tax=Athelia psychrophila TaxID=1759441 RepID=A0A166WC48_9AGAM|nr:hypothetical protein FIBSPDRAFT_847521 [Fibularhizoctonia sp. CBS 109695]
MAHGLNKHDQRSSHFEGYEDEQEIPSSPLSKRGRVKSRQTSAPREASLSPDPEIFKRRSNAKSKARMVAADPGIDEGGSGQELDESSSRGRSGRGQTPGPPVRSRPTTGMGRDKRAS